MGTRWTPLALLIGIAALLLAGAGVVSVIAYEDDDASVTEALQSPDPTTTTTDPAATTSTTAAVVPPPAETTTTGPSATRPRRTTTTRPQRTTTTVRAATTTTPPGAPPTSTAPLCSVDQIDVSAGPERDSYSAGQPVTVRSTIRNRSSVPCFYRGYTVTFTFRDPTLEVLVSSVVHADDVVFRHFVPGQTITHAATWDPRSCATPPCPPPASGIYSVEATWSFSGGRYGATRQFVVS